MGESKKVSFRKNLTEMKNLIHLMYGYGCN